MSIASGTATVCDIRVRKDESNAPGLVSQKGLFILPR